MNNADMPAMPQSVSRSSDGAMISSSDFSGCEGLTKREYFAGLAMQGILSNHDLGTDYELDMISESSVQFADALLSTLEETK